MALVAHGAPPLAELDPSLSRFVLGSEREGLPEDVVAACAATATIPLAGAAESLNVAMAGTIALYDWRPERARLGSSRWPRIVGVWTSPGRKSGRSVAHERRRAIAGEGLEGCAHANPPKREVLFVSKEHLDSVGVEPGAIRENLTVEGTDVEQWPIGQRVRSATRPSSRSRWSAIPATGWTSCAKACARSSQGKRGMLARIVESGEVAVGDPVELL